MKDDDRVKVKTVGRALELFDYFIDYPSLGVSELSRMTGYGKSNISDMLSTFQAMEYLEQDAESGRYRLTLKLLRFAHTITANLGLHRYVFPYMQKLANELGETVYFGVPNGSDVVYIDAAFPTNSLNSILIRSMTGDRAPMYCTGIGKAMLSLLPPEEQIRAIPEQLIPFTEYTFVDREALRMELAKSRDRGYSIDNMEHEYGIKCVGVPVTNRFGHVAAGLSVSGPSLRFDAAMIERAASKLIDVARELREYM